MVEINCGKYFQPRKLFVYGCGQSWDPPEQLWSFSASFRAAVDAAEPPSSDPGTALPAACDFCHPPPQSLPWSAAVQTDEGFLPLRLRFLLHHLLLLRCDQQLRLLALPSEAEGAVTNQLTGVWSSTSPGRAPARSLQLALTDHARLNGFWATANEEITEIK